ncbi:hypothetical protein HHI36_022049 [Cryptolaemus montrouzieri]|uniref:DUF4200 domain-containing protein n=1 Tax=Cryptolaemus montrouzieri TaxID=559131 RepID=A0ABD2MYU9_9CUCU
MNRYPSSPLRKSHFIELDAAERFLMKNEKRRATNQALSRDAFSRYGDFEDILTFFPKTKRKVEDLKIFEKEACKFDVLLNHEIVTCRSQYRKHEVAVKKQDLLNKLHEYREMLNAQWNEISSKEKGLSDYFKYFDEFLVYNHEKRQRLLAAVKENVSVRIKREIDIEQMKEEVASMRQTMEILYREIEKVEKYQHFLYSVVLEDPQRRFRNVNDILTSFQYLLERKDIIEKTINEKSAYVSKSVWRIMDLMKHEDDTVTSLTMKISTLHRTYDESKIKALEKHDFLMCVVEKLREKYQEFLICKPTIYSVYSLMNKRSIERHARKHTFAEQLKYMSGVIDQLDRIYKKSSRLM